MNDDPPFPMDAEERIRAEDLLVWRTPWSEAQNGVHSLTGTPNPILHNDLVIGSIFSPGAIRAVDASTGELRWHRDIGRLSTSEPLVVSDLVLAQGYPGLFALHIEDGSLAWTAPLSDCGELSMTLIEADDTVILGDSNGQVFGFDVHTGKRRWRRSLSRANNRRVHGKAVVHDGCFIVANNAGSAYSLKATTGKVKWRSNLGESVCATGLGFNGCVLIQAWTGVIGLDPASGSEEFSWTGEGDIVNSVAASDEAFFVSTRCEGQIAVEDDPHSLRYCPEHLYAVRRDEELWRTSYPPYCGAQIVYSEETNKLYESTLQGLGITDPTNGRRRWTITNFPNKDGLPNERTAIPCVTRDRMYLISSDGSLVCLRHP